MNQIREIDTGTPLTRFARGWHCLGLADDFRDGKPHGIQAFGGKLVVYADTKGDIHVLDGYCRHLGADLAMGSVKGDNVACPFHDWRWNGATGRCVEIPYARRVPKLARTRKWQTLEVNGQLLVWHDPEGSTPSEDLNPPQIEGMGTDRWSAWSWNSILIEGSHCREIVDNNVDMAHFFYIHYAYPTYFKNVFEGHTASQFMESKGRQDFAENPERLWEGTKLRSEATYFGPSYMINWLHNDLAPDFTINSVLINCHYPISQDSFMLQFGVSVEVPEGMSKDKADKLARSYSKVYEVGFLQDVEIWKHKTRIENPLLCEEDGALYQYRRWYEQFYVDAAEVTSDMTDRFELEVDTTHAYDVWQREVDENMQKRSAATVSG
ncbi:3-ketosteroid-9-alpha-hydroxylase [Mycolicibacterium litorale]|nr:3-ketosteroid-9-alpha-hydroxylase [Mycolicibacterium litorale]